jgi:hypothetical protein
LKLDPNAAETLWARAEISEARGQSDAAIQDFQKAIALKPTWRLAGEGLKRLGAPVAVAEEHEVPGLGVGAWQVVSRGAQFFATNADYPEMRIPLEMIGEGMPKLLAWDLKEPPHKGYGILRFAGGKVTGKSGPEDTELAAIIDIDNGRVLAIQPHRQGARVATWTWDDDRVQIASVDGVTDEFSIRSTKAPVAALSGTAGAQRRLNSDGPTSAAWAPWDQPIGTPRNEQQPQRRAQRSSKPKTLFDLLFN